MRSPSFFRILVRCCWNLLLFPYVGSKHSALNKVAFCKILLLPIFHCFFVLDFWMCNCLAGQRCTDTDRTFVGNKLSLLKKLPYFQNSNPTGLGFHSSELQITHQHDKSDSPAVSCCSWLSIFCMRVSSELSFVVAACSRLVTAITCLLLEAATYLAHATASRPTSKTQQRWPETQNTKHKRGAQSQHYTSLAFAMSQKKREQHHKLWRSGVTGGKSKVWSLDWIICGQLLCLAARWIDFSTSVAMFFFVT